MELQNIQRLAVFKMRNIGDVLMITPALRALRETFPEARLTVVVNSGTEAMLANNPHIDEVLVYQRNSEAGRGLLGRIGYELHFLCELRKRHFDLTISFTEGDRAIWYSLLSGARCRLGAVHYTVGKYNLRRLVYNLVAPSSPPPMHEVERHFYLLEKAGLKLRSSTPGDLCLVVSEELRAWARKELEALRPAPVVHIHPVSRWLWKCWSNESMARVIDWLQTERKARVVVTTGPVERERQRAREIVDLCQTKPLFYEGNLSLGQIAAISAGSAGYFGVDTAPMHMAAAVGVPVLALFGPTDPVSWRPWSSRGCVISQPCLCNQTSREACDWSQVRACLAAITVAQAQKALDDTLALPKPQASSGS